MKTLILAATLSLGSFSAYSSIVTGQGQSKGIGGNVDCEYPQLLQEYQLEAEKAADQDALKKCRFVKRISDYEDTVSCYYKGPWMSYSVIEIHVTADYDCIE